MLTDRFKVTINGNGSVHIRFSIRPLVTKRRTTVKNFTQIKQKLCKEIKYCTRFILILVTYTDMMFEMIMNREYLTNKRK